MPKKNYSSLENALRLMDIFTVEKPEYKLNELADELSIAPSTVHRLLTTLRSEGFVVKDSISNKYRLGISIRSLESVITKKMDLFHLSQDILEQITMKTGLSASLAVIFQEMTFYLNVIQVDNPLFYEFPYIGKRCSYLSSSAGKVLLVSKNDSDLKAFDQDPSTISKLRNQLQINGYIQSNDDTQDGISTIAVPIKNKRNETIAALEMIGRKKSIETNVQTIVEAGLQLSNRIKNE